MRRGNKFHAEPTTVDGIRFASKAEARRYANLKLLERAKRIRDLTLQPAFPLHGKNGSHIGRYTADFRYDELGADGRVLADVVEDVKSPATAKGEAYRLRIKLFKDNYPEIDFREVKG